MLPSTHPTTTTTARWSLTMLRKDPTQALVRIIGEWDLAKAHLLGEQLAQHQKAGRRLVRLDVSAVSFLDCSCLGVLVTAHQRLLATRGTLVLTGVTPRLTRLLSLAQLDRVLLTTSLTDLGARPDHNPRPSRPPRRPAVRSITQPV